MRRHAAHSAQQQVIPAFNIFVLDGVIQWVRCHFRHNNLVVRRVHRIRRAHCFGANQTIVLATKTATKTGRMCWIYLHKYD